MNSWKGVTLEKIADTGNMEKARFYAGQRKEKRSYVKSFKKEDLEKLQNDILNETYELSPAYEFDIVDQYSHKKRHIESPAFRDQVLHHAIVQVFEDEMLKYLHPHQLASIKRRGIEKGRKLVHKWATHNRKKAKWVFKADVKKYYNNIDIDLLLAKLSTKIPDKRVVNLIGKTIRTSHGGLCLGSYISQWLANFFLADYLHTITREFRLGHIMCHMDNITITATSHRTLKKLKNFTVEYLAKESLAIKLTGPESAQIFMWKRKLIDAVGYKTEYTGFQKLRGHIYLSITRMMRRVEKAGSASRKQARSLLSRYGFVKHSSCTLLRQKMEVFIKEYKLKSTAKAA